MRLEQRYEKVSGEANEKQSFSGLTIPNRILAYRKIVKGESNTKRSLLIFYCRAVDWLIETVRVEAPANLKDKMFRDFYRMF